MFHDWMNRAFQPMNSIAIETIQGEEAMGSPYLEPLKEMFKVVEDYKKVTLHKKYWR